MNKRLFCLSQYKNNTVLQLVLITCSVCLFSGSLYAVGEKTISLGGVFTWNLAEYRSGIAEVGLVRPNPVLTLSSAANTAQTDMYLSFDEGSPALFRDAVGHYRLVVPSPVEAVSRGLARAGTGAALFSNSPLRIEPQSKNALFAANTHMRDFTLEFWLYPVNLENGEEILNWTASHPLRSSASGGHEYTYQRIQCLAVKNRLQWNFRNFFASPDESTHLEINFSGDLPVAPKTWSHHLIRFDADTGMIEYLVNGRSEAIVYASSSGGEGGSVYAPVAGAGGSFALGGGFRGIIDEFKIHSSCVMRLSTEKYLRQGGRIETRAIDLGDSGSGILKVEACGGRTLSGEYRQNGRFRFADDSEMQFFIRAADRPYSWDDSAWRSFIPGADIAQTVKGRYVQLAVDFYPSENGEGSPYLEELRIVYMPNEPPLPPQSLVASAVDGGVRLSWKNSPDTDTAGYLVYYGTVRGEYFGEDAAQGPSPIDVGKRNSVLIDGLKNGTLYYFKVAAYDSRSATEAQSFHAGEFSREITARPLAGLELAEMPR